MFFSCVFFFLFFFLPLSFHDIWCCGARRCTSLRRSCSNSSIERRNAPIVCRTTTIHLTQSTIPTTFFFDYQMLSFFFCPPLLISSKCQIKDVRRPHAFENRVVTQSLRCDCVWGHFVSWSTPFLRECTGEVRRELERTFELECDLAARCGNLIMLM